MARKKSATLTEVEQRIMEVVWERQSATVADVVEVLSQAGPLAYNSVQTMMKILETKGYLKHKEVGRAFVYRPVIDRAQAARSAVEHLLGRFFNNSPELLALNLIEHERLSVDQLADLRARIAQARHDHD